MTKIFLVHAPLGAPAELEGLTVQEGHDLIVSLEPNAHVLGEYTWRSRTPNPKSFLGSGAAAEVQKHIEHESPDFVFINASLNPGQGRRLEALWNRPVKDRTRIILDIFSKRAKSKEGQLQYQMAECQYRRAFLVGQWSHLERQRRMGHTGGPGEGQLELDRRLLRRRILRLSKKIENLTRTRALNRQSRRSYKLIAFVGYTNVGKTSTFQRLTTAREGGENKSFATLDPTVRSLLGPGKILGIDTVGLIMNLPSFIKAGFRATFEMAREADLIVHVRDCGSPYERYHANTVEGALEDFDLTHIPVLEVWNKADLLPPHAYRPKNAFSAVDPEQTIDPLLLSIHGALFGSTRRHFLIPPHRGDVYAYLHRFADIIQESYGPKGWEVEATLLEELDSRLLPFLHP